MCIYTIKSLLTPRVSERAQSTCEMEIFRLNLKFPAKTTKLFQHSLLGIFRIVAVYFDAFSQPTMAEWGSELHNWSVITENFFLPAPFISLATSCLLIISCISFLPPTRTTLNVAMQKTMLLFRRWRKNERQIWKLCVASFASPPPVDYPRIRKWIISTKRIITTISDDEIPINIW